MDLQLENASELYIESIEVCDRIRHLIRTDRLSQVDPQDIEFLLSIYDQMGSLIMDLDEERIAIESITSWAESMYKKPGEPQ